MNPNELNNNQQSTNMPRVAPPTVKPPVVAPPTAKTVVTPPITKPVVVSTNVNKQNIASSSINELGDASSVNNIKPEQRVDLSLENGQQLQENKLELNSKIEESTIKREESIQNPSFTEPRNVEIDSNEPKINDLVRGQVKIENINEKSNETTSSNSDENELDDETIIKNYMKKLKRRKIIKTIFSIGLVAGLVFLVIKFFPINTTKKVEETKKHISVIYDKDNYIAVKGNNGYGYINTKGKTIIPFQYKYAYDFYGDYALVEKEDEENKYNIIDLKGNVIKTTPFMPFYHIDYGVWEIENKLYNDKLELITKDNQTVLYISNGYFYYQNHEGKEYGILNSKGKKVLEFSIEQSNLQVSTNEFSSKEVYVVSQDENNNINIINLSNLKTVFTKANDEVEINHVNNNIFKVLNKNDNTYTWIYIKNGEVVYETNEILNNLNVYDYQNDILVADSKYGKYFYDVKTKEITNEPKSKSKFPIYGYNIITENNLMGIVKDDKTILETKYTNIKFLDDALFNYIKNDRDKEFVLAIDYGKTYLIDVNNNKTIATFNSINYILFKNTTFLRLDILNSNGDLDHYLIYNLMTGQTLEAQLNENINYGVNYISINDGKKVRYYNNEFKKIYEERL